MKLSLVSRMSWNGYAPAPIPRLAEKYNIPIEGEGWKEVLADCMMQLNCDAVNHRYSHHAYREEVGDYTYQSVFPQSSEVQVFKTLFGWLYQCREGDVPKTNLYQFFQEINHWQAVKIVRDSKEYDLAAWV